MGRQASKRRIGVGLAATLVATLAKGGVAVADPADLQLRLRLPTIETASAKDSGLLATLSEADAIRYRRILDLQAKGKFADADREIQELDNRILMGHVLAQRLLRSKSYHASYGELRAWLEKYADHPQAMRMFILADNRRPSGAPLPPDPRESALDESGSRITTSAVYGYATTRDRTPRAEDRVAGWRDKIERKVAKDDPDGARRLLEDRDVLGLIDTLEHDLARWVVARAFLADDRVAEAYDLAHGAAVRSGRIEPRIHWTAGLAAWRLRDARSAAMHFTALTHGGSVSGEDLAMSALWAARAELRAGRPQMVTPLLRTGAAASNQFYGRLAQTLLGQQAQFDWQSSASSDLSGEVLFRYPAWRRVLALMQIKETDAAEQEMLGLASQAQPELARALETAAQRLELPAAQLLAAERLQDVDGRDHASSLYPIPRWQPRSGFKLDRALIYAIMRAESGFDPTARSAMGAIGVMQVLPETAEVVRRLGDARYYGPGTLYDPASNMDIAQAWLRHMMKADGIGDSLIHLIIGYNAGPRRAVAWSQKMSDMNDDPLLFIESVRNTESRNYVKRVLANLWAYRARFGQESPSLRELAENRWPRVEFIDRGTTAKPVSGRLAPMPARRIMAESTGYARPD
ncbi:MAG: lytic transglycosylase domain-containing protein [Geminicoccaceae bacterium]